MKVYIATALERVEEQKALAAQLVDLGHSLTYDWSVHGSVQDQGWNQCRLWFHGIWDSAYKSSGCGWEANPWVWVVEFKMVKP